MTDSTARALARALFALVVALLVVALTAGAVLIVQSATTFGELAPELILALGMVTFPVVGVLVATRQPRNAVGWILLGVGLAWQLAAVAGAYTAWSTAHPETLPGAVYATVLTEVLWIPGLGPLGTFLILLFPDGRLPTPRWRWWARVCGASVSVATVGFVFLPGEISVGSGVLNPIGIDALAPLEPVVLAAVLSMPVCIAGCAVAAVRRFRRSLGVQRLQLKWLAAAAGVVSALYLVMMILGVAYDWSTDRTPLWLTVLQNVSLGSFVLLPLAVGVAILKYRLYDIDRLINRALVYGTVSAVLVGVYVLGVVSAGAAMRAVTGSEQGNLAVAGSTLAVAALFRPFRARVQNFIDRRFYRAKYNAALTVEAFSARLRQETELATLSQELRDVVTQTVQPARVSVWIATRD